MNSSRKGEKVKQTPQAIAVLNSEPSLQIEFHQRDVYLDHSCGLRDRVSAFASGLWRSVTQERNPICILNSTFVFPDGMRSRTLLVDGTHSQLLGWVSIQVLLKTLATCCGWRLKQVLPVCSARVKISVFGCGEYIERKLLSFATHTRSRQGGSVGGYLSTCQ